MPQWNGLLANDRDPSGNPLTATLVAGPAHGTLTLDPAGDFTYSPDPGFTGTDEFTYTAGDGTATSNVADVLIDVTNSAPVAGNAAYQATQNDTLFVGATDGVLAAASDADGDALTAALVSGPADGTLHLGASGAFTYVPAPGFTGTDFFTYTASDGLAVSNVATVTIAVSASASDVLTFAPPVAQGDTYSVAHDHVLTVGPDQDTVLSNDSDPSGDPLTATLVAGPSDGTLDLADDGSFTYVPAPGFAGTDTFTYTASDGFAVSNVATVTLTVTGAAAPPATAASYTTSADNALVVDVVDGLLPAAFDADGDPLTAAPATGPSNGTLQLNSDGSFTYTPDAGFVGTDAFTYTVSDGLAASAPATVTLDVTDMAPTAGPASFSTPHDTPLVVAAGAGLLTDAGDAGDNPLTVSLVAGPGDGTLTLDADGSFTYVPDPGYVGADSFSYQVGDGVLTSAPAVVSLTMTEVPPTAGNASFSTPHDVPLEVGADQGLLADAGDPSGAPLTVSLVGGPAHGRLALNGDGSFSYTPAAGYAGTDAFTYQVSDGLADSNVATVSLTVVNHAPTARGASFSTPDGVSLLVGPASGLLTDAADADGDPLTVSLAAGPADGTLTLDADGSFIYTPDAGFSGTDSFTYTVSDGLAASAPATVTLTVTDPAPVAANLSYSLPHDTALYVSPDNSSGGSDSGFLASLWSGPSSSQGLLADVSDPSGNALTVSAVTGPAHGALDLAADGSFSYTPDAGFTGTDAFTYTVSDGLVSSNVATVTLTVTDTTPTAANATYTVTRNGSLSVTQPQGNLLAGATTPAGAPLTAALVAGPANGSLTFTAQGSFLYTPTPGFVGTDAFTYTVGDGLTVSSPATVTIHVVDTPPVAANDSYAVLAGSSLSLPSADVLYTASDADGDALTAALVGGPANGTLQFHTDGTFTYVPDAGFTGTDSFTYTASDGVLSSNVATVTLTVGTDPFAVQDQNAQVIHDAAIAAANAPVSAAAFADQQAQTAEQFAAQAAEEASAAQAAAAQAAAGDPAQATLADALAGAEGQYAAGEHSAHAAEAAAQGAAAVTDAASADAADTTYEQALSGARVADVTAVAAAEAADQGAVAAADSQLAATDAAAARDATLNGLDATYAGAVSTATATLDQALDAAGAAYARASAQARATLNGVLASAGAAHDTSEAQAAAERAGVVGPALAAYDAAVARAAQARQDTLAAAAATWTSATATAAVQWTTSVADATETRGAALAAADAGWRTALDDTASQWQDTVAAAGAALATADAQALTAWTTTVTAATSALDQAQVQAALGWQDVVAPAGASAAAALAQDRAGAVGAWAQGQGTSWAAALAAEAAARVVLLAATTPAEAALAEAQAQSAATWWATAAPAEATFAAARVSAAAAQTGSDAAGTASYHSCEESPFRRTLPVS